MTARTQMHHARQGVVTPQMRRVAEREGLPADLVCDEVARGRLVIPANVHHLAQRLDPMGIGAVAAVKINANIGNSAVDSDIDGELEKLHHAVHYGADTVMDLSTGGNIDGIREAILAASPVPIGTVPIYQAVQQVKRVEDLTGDALIDNIEHQARQGVDYITVHCGLLREHIGLALGRVTGHRVGHTRSEMYARRLASGQHELAPHLWRQVLTVRQGDAVQAEFFDHPGCAYGPTRFGYHQDADVHEPLGRSFLTVSYGKERALGRNDNSAGKATS